MAVVEVGAFRAEVVEDPSAKGPGLGHVVTLVGEIDVATAPSLEAALSIAFSERGNVIVDMAGVTFMGSSGIGELVRARRRLLSVDGNLSVRSADSTSCWLSTGTSPRRVSAFAPRARSGTPRTLPRATCTRQRSTCSREESGATRTRSGG
jgi:ABC-type transporter Mla MlaB component